jgi:hypothetical protein
MTLEMNRSLATLKFCAAAAALLTAGIAPVHADAISDLSAQVTALQASVNTLKNTSATQQTAIATLQYTVTNQQVNIATLQNSSIAYQNAITSLISNINYIKTHPTPGSAGPQGVAGPIGPVGPIGATGATGMTGAIGALTPAQLAILNLMSINNKDLTITGNLHIINGLGATNGLPNTPENTSSQISNGLGNLIIGYNQMRSNVNVRTGSHNLILGDYQSYSSVGGIVAGWYNSLTGQNSSVLGGLYNTGFGMFSTVNGGKANYAYGVASTVGGGYSNEADGACSAISGGEGNWEAGDMSVISGGKMVKNSAKWHWGAGAVHNSYGPAYFQY